MMRAKDAKLVAALEKSVLEEVMDFEVMKNKSMAAANLSTLL